MEFFPSTIVLQWLVASYIPSTITASNLEIHEDIKGDKQPGVGDGGRKEKEKSIENNQGGDMSSKGVGADDGLFRWPTQNNSNIAHANISNTADNEAGLD